LSTALFADRVDAGRRLGRALAHRKQREEGARGQADRLEAAPLVLALPRGGVPVAYEVAKALQAPLDVLVVRKLGMPGHEELALGAIASGGAEIINGELVRSFGVSPAALSAVRQRESAELARREREYRGDRPPLNVKGRTVIVVDDGIATGATIRVAVAALRQSGAHHVTVAVPLASPDVAKQLMRLTDDLICLETPEPFRSVGQWYARFDQTTDEQVRRTLEQDAVEFKIRGEDAKRLVPRADIAATLRATIDTLQVAIMAGLAPETLD